MKIRPYDTSLARVAYRDRAAAGTGFGEMLKRMVEDTNALQTRSQTVSEAAIAGAPVEAHDVMIAAEESRLAFDLMLEVRNKLLDAYRELMQIRM